MTGGYISQIKHSALKRHLEYTLTKEYLWQLYLKQNKKCALTGLDIVFKTRGKNQINPTASLDRIDSSRGYVEDNVQWLHKDIKNIKQHYTIDTLVNYCKLIIDNYEKHSK